MVCPKCSKTQKIDEPLKGILDVESEGKLSDKFTNWDFLPVEQIFFPNIPVGQTNLWSPSNLQNRIGLPKLMIKNDSENPTGSLKDRASFLVAAFAKKFKISEIVLASTGNAGSSMAGIGASANLKITVFLPEKAPRAKIIQALQYGANVIAVKGNYDKAYDLSMKYSEKYNVLSRNTGYNPMTIEGKKTVSIEIVKQLGHAPDHVFVPTGDGVILSGVYKGFKDLLKYKVISHIPKIYAVQAEGSNVINNAFISGKFSFKSTNTVADSICVDVPKNGYRAISYLKEFNGKCITVTDSEILNAQFELAKTSGLFVEPAAATAYAGLLADRNEISEKESIVILATGHGLKDTESAEKNINFPNKSIESIDQL